MSYIQSNSSNIKSFCLIPFSITNNQYEPVTIFNFLIPLHKQEKEETVIRLTKWIKQLRRWFEIDNCDLITNRFSWFLNQLPFHFFKDIQLREFTEFENEKIGKEYSVQIGNRELSRDLSDEEFITQFILYISLYSE